MLPAEPGRARPSPAEPSRTQPSPRPGCRYRGPSGAERANERSGPRRRHRPRGRRCRLAADRQRQRPPRSRRGGSGRREGRGEGTSPLPAGSRASVGAQHPTAGTLPRARTGLNSGKGALPPQARGLGTRDPETMIKRPTQRYSRRAARQTQRDTQKRRRERQRPHGEAERETSTGTEGHTAMKKDRGRNTGDPYTHRQGVRHRD